MILIITDNNDESTCRVIDWLNFYNAKYIVLTPKNNLTLKGIDENGEVEFFIDNDYLSTSNITRTWYRRGYVSLSDEKIVDNNKLALLLQRLVEEENEVLKEYFSKKIFNKSSLSTYATSEVNKLEVLYMAKELGINIPDSKVLTNKSDLQKTLINFKNGLITKTVSPGLAINSREGRIYGYTELIDASFLSELSEDFYPSLVQENIKKKFEIRSFFLENDFYSMAIFSQENEQTKIDYRHYDEIKPNRFITFKLPESLKKRLKKLMLSLDLNNGSIDLIYGENKQFYFIEVNPIGQYDRLSVPCNNYLHKRIAKYLIK